MMSEVIKTPDSLVAKCRSAVALGQTKVYATRELLDYFNVKPTDYSFNMMGVTVIQEGMGEKFDEASKLTLEQANFPKA